MGLHSSVPALLLSLCVGLSCAAPRASAADANGASFGPRQIIANNTGDEDGFMRSAVAVDIDGDGHVDVLTYSQGGDIAWYKNNGDGGSFAAASIIISGSSGSLSAIAADMDGDGDADVLGGGPSGGVVWARNDNGSFDAPPVVITTSGCSSLIAADLDGDGDIDVLTDNGQGPVWYENDGNRSFETPASSLVSSVNESTLAVSASDLDSNGGVDIISANRNGSVIWYSNVNGNGNFGATASSFITTAMPGAQSVVPADLDGDGDSDVLVAAFGGKIAWFMNDGDGKFTATPSSLIDIAGNTQSANVGDFDGDGDLDVLVASYGDNTVAWYRNLLVCTARCEQQRQLALACHGQPVGAPCSVSRASSSGTSLTFRAAFPAGGADPISSGLVAALGRGDANVTLPLLRATGARAPNGHEATPGWYLCRQLRVVRDGSHSVANGLASFNASCELPDAGAGALGPGLRLAIVGQGDSGMGDTPLLSVLSVGPAYSPPAPALLPRTLRSTPGGTGAAVLQYSSFQPQDVFFDVRNIGVIVSSVRVGYIPAASPGGAVAGESPCAVRSLTPVNGSDGVVTVRCRTAATSGGTVHFRVHYGGQVGTGTDLYELTVGPAVHGAGGCASDSANRTAGCSTEGGDMLTIRGSAFGTGNKTRPSVTVGSTECQLLRHDDTIIECVAPAGTGTLQPVVVTATVGETAVVGTSPPGFLVSYAQPEITHVSSPDCVQAAGNAVRVEHCPRDRPTTLSVLGRSFGLSGAEVRVGVLACANATLSAPLADGQRRVVCTLAPALQLVRSLAIEVVQRNGRCGGGGGEAALSFEQCPPGTHQGEGLLCEACPRNEFQPDAGQTTCIGCQSGSYKRGTNVAASGSCESCPDGAACAYKKPAASLSGWWLFEERGSLRVRSLRCIVPDRCLAAAACYPNSTLPFDVGHASCCGSGRVEAWHNPMCGACSGDGMSEWGGECVRCERVNVPLVLGSLAGGVALLLALERVTLLSSGATLKILVAFAQTLYAFFSADLSSPVSAGGALLSLSPLDLPRSCAAPASDLTKAVLPLVQVLALVALLAALLLGNVAHWLATRRGSTPFKRSHFLRVLTAVAAFAYIPTLRVAARLLQCDDVTGGGGERRLRQFPTVVCSGAAYGTWLLASWALAGTLLLAGCAFVSLYGQRKYREYARGEGGRAASKFAEERFGFVFRSYRASGPLAAAASSWEAVVLCRSTVFVVAATLVDDWQSRFSLLAGVAFLALLLLLLVRPYASGNDNALEMAALVVIVLVGIANSASWHAAAGVELATAALFYGFLSVALGIVARRVWRSERFADLRARAVRTVSSSSPSRAGRAEQQRYTRGRAASFCGRLWCWYHAAHRRTGSAKDTVRGVDDAPLLEVQMSEDE